MSFVKSIDLACIGTNERKENGGFCLSALECSVGTAAALADLGRSESQLTIVYNWHLCHM